MKLLLIIIIIIFSLTDVYAGDFLSNKDINRIPQSNDYSFEEKDDVKDYNNEHNEDFIDYNEEMYKNYTGLSNFETQTFIEIYNFLNIASKSKIQDKKYIYLKNAEYLIKQLKNYNKESLILEIIREYLVLDNNSYDYFFNNFIPEYEISNSMNYSNYISFYHHVISDNINHFINKEKENKIFYDLIYFNEVYNKDNVHENENIYKKIILDIININNIELKMFIINEIVMDFIKFEEYDIANVMNLYFYSEAEVLGHSWIKLWSFNQIANNFISLKEFEKALYIINNLHDLYDKIYLFTKLSRHYFDIGEIDASNHLLYRALINLDHINNQTKKLELKYYIIENYIYKGQYSRALQLTTEQYNKNYEFDNVNQEIDYLYNIALIFNEINMHKQVEEIVDYLKLINKDLKNTNIINTINYYILDIYYNNSNFDQISLDQLSNDFNKYQLIKNNLILIANNYDFYYFIIKINSIDNLLYKLSLLYEIYNLNLYENDIVIEKIIDLTFDLNPESKIEYFYKLTQILIEKDNYEEIIERIFKATKNQLFNYYKEFNNNINDYFYSTKIFILTKNYNYAYIVFYELLELLGNYNYQQNFSFLKEVYKIYFDLSSLNNKSPN